MKNKIKPAKICYNHIGGKLGTLLLEQLVAKGWIAKASSTDKHFYITPLGESNFEKLGIDLSLIPSE